jgi:predicted metalloprotease with PDZ domain
VEGGYDLVWSEEPNAADAAWDKVAKRTSAAVFSLGLSLDKDGVVLDAIGGMPAAVAGIFPEMRIVAIDGRRYSSESLKDALGRSKRGEPVELLVESGDFFKTVKVDASRAGERYPHLGRDANKPDLLAQILAPKTPRPPEAVMPPPKKEGAR